jgi:hypothetical protein
MYFSSVRFENVCSDQELDVEEKAAEMDNECKTRVENVDTGRGAGSCNDGEFIYVN